MPTERGEPKYIPLYVLYLTLFILSVEIHLEGGMVSNQDSVLDGAVLYVRGSRRSVLRRLCISTHIA